MQTLSDVFGPGVVFNPRTSWTRYHMLRRGDEVSRDAMTGVYCTLAGSTEVICARATINDDIRDLIRDAGLPWQDDTLTYDSPEEFRDILTTLTREGRKVSLMHVLPPDELPESCYWIPRSLLIHLNDKANLGEWAPSSSCPPRRVMPIQEAAGLAWENGSAIVIKGSTEVSTGSGGAVVIVRGEAQLREIPERLGGCRRVVVEEFQPFIRTMCLNLAADRTGAVHYLGSADQLVSAEGAYLGGWIGSEFPAPPDAEALAHLIMQRAVRAGYVGYAGFDMGLLPDGRILVFDLNFRLCASTPALLWFPEAQRRLGPECHMRSVVLNSTGSFKSLVELVRPAVRESALLPLGGFDPARSVVWHDRPPALRACVIGRNRAETEARCEALTALGLSLR